MVVSCCIQGCKSEKYPGCEMSFHGFPSDEKLKTKWIEATSVTGNVKYKRICPLHFKKEDFVVKGSVVRLKQNVVPTFCKPPFRTYSNEDKMIIKSNDISYVNYDRNSENGELDMHTDAILRGSNDTTCLNTLSGNTQKMKIVEGIARCKCCLESNRLRSMWQQHLSSGQREVYGTMLVECFALHWDKPENPKNSSDLICEPCITRLRDAVSFKAEVLASEQLLSGQLEAVNVEKLKQEQEDADVNTETGYLHDEDNNIGRGEEVDSCDDNCADVDDNDDGDRDTGGDTEFVIKAEPNSTSNYTVIVSDNKEASRKKRRNVTLKKRSSKMTVDAVTTRTNVASKRFRMSNSDLLKDEDEILLPLKHLKHPEMTDSDDLTENLKKSLEVEQTKELSEAMAYDVSQEIICKEINRIPEVSERKNSIQEERNKSKNGVVFVEVQRIIDDDKDDSKKTIAEIKEELLSNKTGSKVKQKDLNGKVKKSSENRLAEMKKQTNNIAVILESTNATPIRRHGGIGYGCCFCSEEFPEAADLKQHTIKGHDVKTKRNYAKGKRPSAYLVKLDITGLKCNLCGNTIDTLEQLYDHLTEVHKKLLYRNAKNYIVPFKFDREELRCLFCEFICNSFKGLLEHMSVHYRNHICEICDAGFLTKNNLFNHTGRHKKGTFKCDFCPKVFDTSSKKAGHQRLVHSSTNGVNRCGYCGEMFGTYRRKEKHLITQHGITLKKLKCKACDKTFETQTALRIHTKRDHLIERRFKCSVCDKRCFTNVQLNQHILKHTGVKKFQCTICLKAYGRKSTLREHMRIHENDRRFKCELCGMAFVQKCSWRGHMLSKHGQQV